MAARCGGLVGLTLLRDRPRRVDDGTEDICRVGPNAVARSIKGHFLALIESADSILSVRYTKKRTHSGIKKAQ